MRIKVLSVALVMGLAACGGDSDAPPPPAETPADQPAAPAQADWLVVDDDARTVTLTLVAGSTSDNMYWNYNGLYGGRGVVTIPEGYEVTLTLENRDSAMAHSVGVGERQASYPQNFADPQPVFAGAMTSNPTSLVDATMPGESETITFTADRAGEFVLICYITAHAATGMYLDLVVSSDGSWGVEM